jgi:hypothetical protein
MTAYSQSMQVQVQVAPVRSEVDGLLLLVGLRSLGPCQLVLTCSCRAAGLKRILLQQPTFKCVLCCCMQMATGQPYGPAAHYTTHPFATQQYGPMPYYTGQQQQQQACPAPAYPAAPPPMGYPVHPQQQQQQQQQQHQGAPGQVPVNRY